MIKTVTCIAHQRLKDVAMRCILTAVKASKCTCGPGSTPDTLACSPRPSSWMDLGSRNDWERERRKMAMKGKWGK